MEQGHYYAIPSAYSMRGIHKLNMVGLADKVHINDLAMTLNMEHDCNPIQVFKLGYLLNVVGLA